MKTREVASTGALEGAGILDCPLCLELGCESKTRFVSAVNTPALNCVLGTTKNLAAIPSLGPLVPGHSLLVTRYHARSFLREQGLMEEATELLRLIQRDWGGPGVGLLCFEHCGSSSRGKTRICTTEHAHLHVAPLPYAAGWAVYDGVMDRVRRGASPGDALPAEYVAVFIVSGSTCSTRAVACAAELPSQFVRQEIARVLGLPEWDWKALQGSGLEWIAGRPELWNRDVYVEHSDSH